MGFYKSGCSIAKWYRHFADVVYELLGYFFMTMFFNISLKSGIKKKYFHLVLYFLEFDQIPVCVISSSTL